MENAVAKIDANSCAGCGSCIGKCPSRAILLNENDVSTVNKDKCNDCGECLNACSRGAITIEYTS